MMPDMEEGNGKVSQAEDAETPSGSATSSRPSVDKDEQPKTPWQKYTAMVYQARGNPSVSPDSIRPPSLAQQLFAEVLGTGIYMFFGLAATAAATTAGSSSGVIQVVFVWAIAITMGVMVAISVSGAHLNPAITFTFMLLRPELFAPWKAPLYMVAQILGATLGAVGTWIIFENPINNFERTYGIVRGQPGSELTAAIFCDFYPSPSSLANPALGWTPDTVSRGGAFGMEVFGTAYLVFIVFAVMDPRNQLRLGGAAIAYSIGLAVLILGCIAGPITGLSINPARDLGPRIVAYAAGWDEIAFPGPNNSWWVWTIAPFFGGPIGGLVYDMLLMRGI
ncbi:Aquaporin-7 [Hondaea fermentalgiana]|uniref:Aquaporin-7 n=1 Tax=Hondaea fermentalgiana TaxID=2315210 RepID=A0A2R5GEI7_9STRA|nr:Aquaporin-7 [Hondaea fermentalgiana]|eukprot:GBG26641.1 Aquaporin-7 [Hondaea fermentalgiana]